MKDRTRAHSSARLTNIPACCPAHWRSRILAAARADRFEQRDFGCYPEPMKIAAPGHEYDPRWPDPLWLAVHEAGHVIARVQLVAAWRLAELDDLVCLESFRSDAIRPVRREGLAREATR